MIESIILIFCFGSMGIKMAYNYHFNTTTDDIHTYLEDKKNSHVD